MWLRDGGKGRSLRITGRTLPDKGDGKSVLCVGQYQKDDGWTETTRTVMDAEGDSFAIVVTVTCPPGLRLNGCEALRSISKATGNNA